MGSGGGVSSSFGGGGISKDSHEYLRSNAIQQAPKPVATPQTPIGYGPVLSFDDPDFLKNSLKQSMSNGVGDPYSGGSPESVFKAAKSVAGSNKSITNDIINNNFIAKGIDIVGDLVGLTGISGTVANVVSDYALKEWAKNKYAADDMKANGYTDEQISQALYGGMSGGGGVTPSVSSEEDSTRRNVRENDPYGYLSGDSQQGAVSLAADIAQGQYDAEDTSGISDAPLKGQDLLDKIAWDQWNKTDLHRDLIYGQNLSALTGEFDETTNPMYGAHKAAAEQSYGTARDAITANMPDGGQLSSELANTDLDKARYLTKARGDLYQNQYDKAYNLATSTNPSQSITAAGQSGGLANQMAIAELTAATQKAMAQAGLNQSSDQFSQSMAYQQEMAEQQRDDAMWGSIGAGVGAVAGGIMGGK